MTAGGLSDRFAFLAFAMPLRLCVRLEVFSIGADDRARWTLLWDLARTIDLVHSAVVCRCGAWRWIHHCQDDVCLHFWDGALFLEFLGISLCDWSWTDLTGTCGYNCLDRVNRWYGLLAILHVCYLFKILIRRWCLTHRCKAWVWDRLSKRLSCSWVLSRQRNELFRDLLVREHATLRLAFQHPLSI